MASDAFIGKWVLIPELCIYEQGGPPRGPAGKRQLLHSVTR